jgi:pyocin large subunit-like protein
MAAPRFTIAFVLMAAGLLCDTGGYRFKCSASQSATTKSSEDFAAKFKLLRMANGVTSDRVAFSQNTYKGPDGEKVFFTIFHLHSAEKATNEFQDRLKEAKKVVDHPAAQRDGSRVDEMAVITTLGPNAKKESTMIINLAGEEFRTVQSDSTADVLTIAEEMKAQKRTTDGNQTPE